MQRQILRHSQRGFQSQASPSHSQIKDLYARLNQMDMAPPKNLKVLQPSHDLTQSSSMLGLWNVRQSFSNNLVEISLVDHDEILKNNYQHTPHSSYVQIVYNFSQEESLRERYSTYQGNSIRYGKIIEEIDALTGDCCYKYMRHFSSDNSHIPKDYTLVTVSVDKVDFLSKLDASKDMKLACYILNASGSTLIAQIDVFQRNSTADPWYDIGNAIFIFVARRNEDRKAYQVPKMRLCEEDDILQAKERFEIGSVIKDWTREKSQRDMKQVMPSYEESKQFHSYLNHCQNLKQKGTAKLIPMSLTERKSSHLMHSQDRNRHGKIFGGYLMRESFDLSWLTAHLFEDSQDPELLRVDQVLFLKPVEVGSTLSLKSKVTYSQKYEGLGNITRVVTKGYNEEGAQTGNFNFLFLSRNQQGKEKEARLVLPESFDEILEYHEATRRLQHEPIQ